MPPDLSKVRPRPCIISTCITNKVLRVVQLLQVRNIVLSGTLGGTAKTLDILAWISSYLIQSHRVNGITVDETDSHEVEAPNHSHLSPLYALQNIKLLKSSFVSSCLLRIPDHECKSCCNSTPAASRCSQSRPRLSSGLLGSV
jgi:hypothetical protein